MLLTFVHFQESVRVEQNGITNQSSAVSKGRQLRQRTRLEHKEQQINGTAKRNGYVKNGFVQNGVSVRGSKPVRDQKVVGTQNSEGQTTIKVNLLTFITFVCVYVCVCVCVCSINIVKNSFVYTPTDHDMFLYRPVAG